MTPVATWCQRRLDARVFGRTAVQLIADREVDPLIGQCLQNQRRRGEQQVIDLRATFELQSFADGNSSLAIHLRSALKVRAPREVAAFDVEAWRDTVLTGAGVEIPEEILPGEAEPKRRAAYAQMLYRSAELRYPTPSLAGQMARSPAWAGQPISVFFRTYPDFEFRDGRITYFLRDHPEVTDLFDEAQAGKAELLRVEQLFHLTPPENKLAVMQPMWDARLRSATQIALLGRQHLLRLPGGLDRKVGTAIYRKAVHITSVALHVYLRYHPRLNSLSPYAVRTPQLPQEQALARAATTLPEWEALFGSTDACECSHCESTLSPAAYLVDSMAFLQRAVAVDSAGTNALDELLDRRPDLGTLQLTCENTETELPQIDLVCEILEDITASADHKTLSGGPLRQTTWDSELLAAMPQHFQPAAYEFLRAAKYPFNRLPFDLWLEEGRRYLKQMGIARHELMQVMPPRPDVGALEIAAEALQMSRLESELIRTPNTRLDDVAGCWGVDPANGTLRTQLGHVETLMLHGEIDYNTLLRLLNTRYVNLDRVMVVTFSGDACALDGAELTRADGSELTGEEFRSFLDRLHRFLRLQRRLGWKEYELDLALQALDVEDFDANGFFPKLAEMQSLCDTFSLPPNEVSSWWGDLDTFVFEDDVPSQYDEIFLDPSLFPDTHIGTDPDLRNSVFGLTSDRTDLKIASTPNPWLATSDGATPPTFTLEPGYSAYIQSATQLIAADLQLLVEQVLPKDTNAGHVVLNLANVSLLYRIASFVRAIGSSVQDYLTVQRITGISPLRTPTVAASSLDSMRFYDCFREIDDGNWSIEQLAYLLLHDAGAAAVLAPAPEDMDAWLTVTSPGFVGVLKMKPANVSAESKTALTLSLGSALSVDAAVLDDLLFFRRPALGNNLLAHLIVDANQEASNLPVPTQDFYAVFETLAKFSLAWKGLALDPSHLAFVLDKGPRLGWTDIGALPLVQQNATDFRAWRRLTEAANLQLSVFTVEESLFGLLQAAREAPEPPETFDVDAFLVQVSGWSGWPLVDVTYLTGPSGLNLSLPDAMQDERPFVALRRAFDVFQRSGVSAEQAHAWTIAELTFSETQSIKHALTLSYAPDHWLEVLAAIQDELRPLRRDALLGYLLHTLGFKDSTEFYHHYLIDPEQAACGRTSRIVEAHAAVQIFAQRILFNLEPFEFPSEDADAWQWRKNYRVWEAARKVFLFPENWLEPEFRDNKSVFFKELEDGLAQDDINLTTAARLYHEYLYKLDQVSRLEIMGMYEDTWTVNGDLQTNVLYVFGRTQDIPHLYYYRRCEDKARWTPWEPVPLDIQSEHLIPIVFNGRLYVFWPDFKLTPIDADVAEVEEEIAELEEQIATYDASIEKTNETLDNLDDPDGQNYITKITLELQVDLLTAGRDSLRRQWIAKIVVRDGIRDDTPANEVEIGMAWSTYAGGRWSSKRLASSVPVPLQTDFLPSDFYFTGWIASDNRLYLAIRANRLGEISYYTPGTLPPDPDVEALDVGFFTFDDCQSKLMFEEAPLPLSVPAGTVTVLDSQQSFNARKLTGTDLSFELGAHDPPDARLLLASVTESDRKVNYAHRAGLGGNELSPFFYTDDQRSYFVRPLPDAWVGLGSDLLTEATQQRTGSGARIAPTGQTGLSTSTHYQGTNAGQIVDRGVQGFSASNAADFTFIDTILGDEFTGGALVAGEALLTGFRYQFTRFYHPYTCLCIKQLSRYGIEGLLNPVRDLDDDSENLYRQGTPLATFDFETTYLPNSDWVLGNYGTEEVEETIDFDHNSAYGPYNWELFFHIPLLVATRLMQNQRFAEARRWFHYIFNPTCTDGEGPERFWKIKPFYEAQLNGPTQTLQELIDLLEQGSSSLEQQVQEWEADPFNVHAIARLRITAYMQTTVRNYLDCLIQEADMLFMRDARESITEAAQLYLLAAEILGVRPTLLPAQEAAFLTPNILLERYQITLGPGFLEDVMDRITSMLPTRSSGVPSSRSGFRAVSGFEAPGTSIDESGQSIPKETTATSALGGTDSFNTLFLFCLPHNDLLYEYWDKVADRLFKIRHCMNISGQVRQLALFAPPIDPALLVRASAAGLDIASIISGLYASLPNYRFSFMLSKALELCGEVRTLGGALLAALVNRDGEELSLLRSTHEVSLLESIRTLKTKAVEEADASLAGLVKSKESAEFRVAYYAGQERVSSGEQSSLDQLEASRSYQSDAESMERTASGLNLLPNISIPLGPGLSSISFGGSNVGAAAQAIASGSRATANAKSYESARSATVASYDRRLKDWRFQADLAKKEIAQLDKQILAGEIRKQIAETDLENHEKQIAQAEEVEEFLKIKFTNQQLYDWMLSKLSSLYFQAYQMAYQIAKQAEQSFRHELGPDESDASFFDIPYWDSLKKGLSAGEQLHHDLRRMEKAYLDANRRDLEITKPISLFQLDPEELLTLRETGACNIHIPELLFDLDFPGHYFRRIKAVRVTIPCVAGPFMNVSATLSLSQSWTRREVPADLSVVPPDPEPDTTVLPQTAIATSTGIVDTGMFELNFRDERYLPFEGAGAISTWHLELPQAIRCFDYDNIADVVLHLSYSARSGGQSFKQAVNAQLTTALNDWKKLVTSGVTLARLFSLRQEFSTHWNRLLFPAEDQDQEITLNLGKQHFPGYLDYVWMDTDDDGKLDTQKSITLRVTSLKVYLDPQGQLPPDAAALSINGTTSAIDADNGLPVFHLGSTDEITNESGIDLTLTFSPDEKLQATDWKDIYLLLNYEVNV
jgi:hypothetical protein